MLATSWLASADDDRVKAIMCNANFKSTIKNHIFVLGYFIDEWYWKILLKKLEE